MIPLEVLSVGAVTPVGDDAATTMAGILAEIQLFDDLDVESPDGELITGGSTRVSARLVGLERLATLGRLAIEECVREAAVRSPLAVFLCSPTVADLGCPPAVLLERIAAECAVAIDLARSKVFANGRAGTTEVLAAATGLLDDPRVPACVVVGVDCLTQTKRIERLLDEGRLLHATNSDGFIPGEAGVALLVARKASAKVMALITGLATESAPSDEPASALASVLRQAVAQGAAGGRLTALIHDGSGRYETAEELSLTASRAPLSQASDLRVIVPALSTGEVGAASGLLSLAVLAFFFDRGELTGPAAATFLADEPIRGAAVMTPARQRRIHAR